MIFTTSRCLLGAGLMSALLVAAAPASAAKIRLAEAATLAPEKLIELVALEYAKKRGVDYDLAILKSDDVANQAVLSGQVDIVLGSNAYRLIQKLSVPARHFFQLRLLAYYPVVAKENYTSWADLNGKEFVVHARGSGTEVLAHMIEAANNIKFSAVSFVPGAQVRANALLRGTIKATLLNIPSLQYVMSNGGGKFAMLPAPGQLASDSALYAKADFLEKNAADVQIIVEELLKVIRRTNADPTFMAAERERLNLLPSLPKDQADGITDFFQVAAQTGMYPSNGGGVHGARADLAFYTESGDLVGKPDTLKVEDFWDFRLLDAGLNKLGRVEVKYHPPSK